MSLDKGHCIYWILWKLIVQIYCRWKHVNDIMVCLIALEEETGFTKLFPIAALVDTLVAKTRAWEEDHGMTFSYDGVPLLAMLEEYAMLRQEREEEKRRMRVCLHSP